MDVQFSYFEKIISNDWVDNLPIIVGQNGITYDDKTKYELSSLSCYV